MSSNSRPLVAEISLNAFRHNIGVVEQLAASSSVVVVVKADAYGHGLVDMARAAEERDLAVASIDEAMTLIESGINNRIWLLEGPFSQNCVRKGAGRNLLWVIHSQYQLDLLKEGVGSFECLLKLDSGMNRLGFAADQLEQALHVISQHKNISLIGCMTHFAESDEPGSQSVDQQIEFFDRTAKAHSLDSLPSSMANSGAILNYAETHRAWVRPGIMLYGGMPSPHEDRAKSHIKPVMSLKSKVIALRRVSKGQSVGYGATWTADKDSLIAVVACGYGDGYPRHALNGTPVWVRNQVAPLAGRVSMDMITIDVTAIPGVSIGDEVELWGEHVSIDQVARQAGTISYELLTGVTKRVPRTYISL